MGQVLIPRHFAPGFGNPKVAPPENMVEIDWSHPLAQDLLFYNIGLRDMVSGKIAQPVIKYDTNESGFAYGFHGLALESKSTWKGGFVWENCTEVARIGGQANVTLVCGIEMDASGNVAPIIGCPKSTTAWTAPQSNIAFERVAATTTAQVHMELSSFFAIQSGADYLRFDGKPIWMGFSKNNTTTARFYRDGVSHSNSVAGVNDEDLVWNSQLNVYAMSRNTAAAASGVDGRLFLQAWWCRALDAGEHAEFYANPFALLRPRVPTLYYTASAPSGPLNLNRLSSMHFMRHYEPISMGE